MNPPRDPQRDTPSADADGVRVRGKRGRLRWAYLALALLLVAGAGIYLLRPTPASRSENNMPAANGASAVAASSQSIASDAPPQVTATAPRQQVDPNDLASYAVKGMPAPPVSEVIERLHAAGIRTGIGAFNPPGTSPPLLGLAVPEGYALPEGYVRHYQATDDGQRIEPILMFSPDFEFLDANGHPVPLPENRVVPPHLAPPGFPLRTIRIPPPQDGRI